MPQMHSLDALLADCWPINGWARVEWYPIFTPTLFHCHLAAGLIVSKETYYIMVDSWLPNSHWSAVNWLTAGWQTAVNWQSRALFLCITNLQSYLGLTVVPVLPSFILKTNSRSVVIYLTVVILSWKEWDKDHCFWLTI